MIQPAGNYKVTFQHMEKPMQLTATVSASNAEDAIKSARDMAAKHLDGMKVYEVETINSASQFSYLGST